ncbi:MAG: amino acid permease [Haloarculaceae archaeon]
MSSHGERSPEAELGLLDATMIGMGAMIGAGIFVLTGLAANIAGPGAILVFVLNGIVTAFTGLSYAELASAIPKSGGATRSSGRCSRTSSRS